MINRLPKTLEFGGIYISLYWQEDHQGIFVTTIEDEDMWDLLKYADAQGIGDSPLEIVEKEIEFLLNRTTGGRFNFDSSWTHFKPAVLTVEFL